MSKDEWRDAFVLELRLREVPGPQIGEALAEVEAHCADSGQSPEEAFGDPVRYAAARAAGVVGFSALRRTAVRAWWIGTAALAGALALWSGINAVIDSTAGEVTLGEVLMVAGLPPLLAVIVALAFRPGMGRRLPLLVVVAYAVCIGAAAASRMLWPQVVLRVPAVALVLIGTLALGVALWSMRSARLRSDRLADPRAGAGAAPTGKSTEDPPQE